LAGNNEQGQQLALDGPSVVLQLIQGQARIEAKLDVYAGQLPNIFDRLRLLEGCQAQHEGERRFLKFWLPVLITIGSLVIAIITAVLTVKGLVH
jgi:hypothetical protein